VDWVATVALLRAVGHVLKKVDAKGSPAVAKAVDFAWKRWRADPGGNAIFWQFIETERNSVLKTYEFGLDPEPSYRLAEDGSRILAEDGSALLLEGQLWLTTPGPFSGMSGWQLVNDALAWWERELQVIEQAAASSGVPD
jgi:hypothetical protein